MRRIATVLVLLGAVVGFTAWRLADVKPDPNQQAVADGCQRDTTKIYTGFAPNWVYVNDKDFPANGPPPAPRWLTGVVSSPASGLLASRVATSDDPITHTSFDLNVDVKVASSDDFLTGVSRDTTSEAGTIHLERESAFYPTWTWPRPGDRITALGSWVWDCDHYQGRGEKTEFHPYRATFVLRNPGGPSPTSPRGEAEGDIFVSSDATPAGIAAECAHQTKGSDQFKPCTHSSTSWLGVNGSYGLTVCPPKPAPRGAQMTFRVVDRGSVDAPPVRPAPGPAGCAAVGFTVDAPRGTRVIVAKQVYVGWSKPFPVDHLRLHFDKLLVRRAMDPSCAPDKPTCPFKDETTLLGQIAPAPGEWQLTWSVDGIWGRWPGTLLAHDGSTFKGHQSVDFWVQRGEPWTLVTEARDCDFGAVPSFAGVGHVLSPCPKTNEVGNPKGDDYGGAILATFRSAAASLGRHVTNASTAGSSCPASNVHGCYQLTYTVSRIR